MRRLHCTAVCLVSAAVLLPGIPSAPAIGAFAAAAAGLPAVGLPAAVPPLPDPTPCPGCWHPPLDTPWQWQLTTPVDQSFDVVMYDIDMFENAASVVASMHAAGRVVVCYISAGTWESFRPDAYQFPDEVLGLPNGWPGERWLDIRRLDVLGPIMQARMDECAGKAFDGVEFDNIDGYANRTGFPLTGADQIRYDTWLANEAHARVLSAALKNDLGQIPHLLPYFDWALDEQCFQYHECGLLQPFIKAGKAVMEVEYRLPRPQFCPQANAMSFNSMRKRLDLSPPRQPCR